MNKQKKLAVKLTVRISVVLMVIFTILVLSITLSTNGNLQRRELEKLELLAQQNASIAKDYMETMINKQESIVAAIQTIQGSDTEKIQFVERLLNTVENKVPNILSLFYVAEPNAFIPGTPDGFSIFVTKGGIQQQKNRFEYVDEPIYQNAVQNGNLTIADPFSKTIDGTNYTVVTVFLPVHDANGKVAGMVGSNVDINVLLQADYNNGGYETFNNEIICGHETVIISSRRPEDIGKQYADVTSSRSSATILQAAVDAKSLTFLDTETDNTRVYRAFVPFYVGNSSTPWLSGTDIEYQEFQQQIIRQICIMILISLAGLIAIILFCLNAIHRILRPLASVENAVGQMAQGNLDSMVTYNGNDEIGRLSQSYNHAMETIAGYIHDIGRSMGEMAHGNFDVYPTRPFIGDFSDIETSITNFIGNICKTLRQINATAQIVMTGSEAVADSATKLSEGSTEQAASIQELDAAITILTEHVRENDGQAREAGLRVQDAGSQLQSSIARMEDLTQAVSKIMENSKEIQYVVKTIEDIAFQTNILALNAAVEAARAGEAGKGFTVVADEVRTLASRSSEAAKNTTEMIQRSMLAIDSGVSLTKQAADSLGIVQVKAASVVEIVDKICVSSQKQLTEIHQVSASSNQISEVIQMNSATAEESAATAEELSSQAHIMRSMTGRFRLSARQDPAEKSASKG